jgi:hypothetical protein
MIESISAVRLATHDMSYRPESAPPDAEWGERFFHLTAPDRHELSFASPIATIMMVYAALLLWRTVWPAANKITLVIGLCPA